MSHRRDTKRAAAGGYPFDDGAPLAINVDLGQKVGSADNVVARVRALLRTWEMFGTGGEANAITELSKALGPDDWKAVPDE